MTNSRRRRSSTGSEVIASTAGEDTWKTWAGRSHGSNNFEFLDLFRGAKRQFNRKFVWGIPPAGTPCPVCFVAPGSKEEWHVTSSCGHAVCRDCLQGYAASLVRDPGHHGPLKCPVCPLPLRPKDAITALCNDPELVKAWDAKIRDEVLRALPGFRHCPRCSNTDKEDNAPSTDSLIGGGFVTPECLAPINNQREQEALSWLNHPLMKQQSLMLVYVLYLYFYTTHPSSSIFVDILHTSIVPFWILRRLWLFGRYIAAFEARKNLFAPIEVECPCCDQAFILNAESELGNTVIADEATQNWIGSNTRPCPSCSVPICKIDGCNHMSCTHCRAKFCWACMRVGTQCRAYNCGNGAPFGNAGTLDDVLESGDHQDGGILDRIDRIAQAGTRLDRRDAMVVAGLVLSIVARESPLVQAMATVLVKVFVFVVSPTTIMSVLVLFVLSARYFRPFRQWLGLPEVVGLQDLMDGSAQGRMAEQLYGVDNAVERRLLEEALQRSMIEQ